MTTGGIRPDGPRPSRVEAGASADGQVVLAADTAAEPGDVGPVDVQRYRHAVADVVNAVDVTGRGEPAHFPGGVVRAADPHEALPVVGKREQFLVLHALQHPE